MNQADTAWMLVATALVLLMTPALAFFYGGLVRSHHRVQHVLERGPAAVEERQRRRHEQYERSRDEHPCGIGLIHSHHLGGPCQRA